MAQPRVSICIPNYNNARYVDQCIRSALEQTCTDTEVVLTDDASTDGSFEIAERYRRDITLLRHPANLGQPGNTNACVRASRGEYLVILHSDDRLLPDFVERLLPILEKHPRVGLVAGERWETDESDQLSAVTPFYDQDCLVPGEKQAKVFMMTAFVPCQVLCRRATFQRAGGVHERHIVNLDGLLWFRCCLHADFAYTRQAVCVYRKHAESTTAHYNRSISHMMEYYTTLTEMFRQAAGRPYLEQHFPAAIRRTAALTLRYCHGVMSEGNFDLASRFLTLATVFDPGIAASQEFCDLRWCLEGCPVDARMRHQQKFGGRSPVRSVSYPPPDGFEPLDLHAYQEVS